MEYTLSTDELKNKFGEISLEIISHRDNTRTSCIRRLSDGAVVACSIVLFNDAGITSFGGKFHDGILTGGKLGEVIRDSGVAHTREVSEPFLSNINFGLGFIFNTSKGVCVSREVVYKINNLLYASIVEFYNPELISTVGNNSEPRESQLISKNLWVVIDELKPGFEEQYLRLTHGFLKKSIHVGIEDQDTFVGETHLTLAALMKDDNTKLFVIASKDQFIGYAAINVHPALHINGSECVVRELYIKEEYQGQMLGSTLMKYVERYAKDRGCKRISLATNWDDEKQRTFYEGLGFARRCDFVIKKLA